MKGMLGLLTATCIVVLLGSLAWINRRQVPLAAAHIAVSAQPAQPQAAYAEQQQAQQMVTLAGPLADYMTKQKPTATATTMETIEQPVVWKPTASDHVGGSPVGTSRPILHKTFRILKTVELPFEVPAHAANAQLRGSYRSFVQPGRSPQVEQQASDESDVECLLLTDQQFTEFLNGRRGDAVFSADGADEQEVNASMPPTLDQPVRYHLVFRNSAREKRMVEADFRIDF